MLANGIVHGGSSVLVKPSTPHRQIKLHVIQYFAKSIKISSFKMTLSSKCDLKTGVRGRSRSLKMAAFDRPHTTSYWSAIVNVALSCSPNLETGWCQHMKVTMSVSKTPQNQSSFRTEQRSIHQSISVVQFQLFNLRSTTTLNCSMKA